MAPSAPAPSTLSKQLYSEQGLFQRSLLSHNTRDARRTTRTPSSLRRTGGIKLCCSTLFPTPFPSNHQLLWE